MTRRDHHNALRTEVIERIQVQGVEFALAVLHFSKNDRVLTLHVNPTSYTTAGLQATDWLAYLGFERNDRCGFTSFHRCYSREVPDGFDLERFANAFQIGFRHIDKAQDAMQTCGFCLPQPEGWGFYFGKATRTDRRGYQGVSGDGHTAMTTEVMKEAQDDTFFFRFSFIDTGSEKAFVTHYRPKHPPLSSEVRSLFSYIGLKEFGDCPVFDFEPCFFRTLRFASRGDNAWGGNVDYAHTTFDAHPKHFSIGIENLLAAHAAAESVGISFLPFDRPAARMQLDIAANIRRSSPSTASGAKRKSLPLPDSFDVAISFAGTEREHAEKLAQLVRDAGYAVFYDDYYPEHLWGKNLTVFFDEIFRNRARLCVMFVSKRYAERKWTIHEARSAQARALEEKGQEYILPIRVDDTQLDGLLPTIGYVPITKGIDRIAEMLIEKLRSR